MLTQEQIDAIKEREAKATKGPWVDHNWDAMENPHVVAQVLWDGKSGCNGRSDVPSTYEDARFIAHAREDVPALLREREELMLEIGKLKKQKDACLEHCREAGGMPYCKNCGLE